MSYSNWICEKCGSVMNMKFGYGYFVYFQCPNGCTPLNMTYTTDSTNPKDKIHYNQNYYKYLNGDVKESI